MSQTFAIETSPLLHAIVGGKTEAAILLLNLDADINKQVGMFTPMVAAIMTENSQLIIEFARRGAVLEKDYEMEFLFRATKSLTMEIIEELIELYSKLISEKFLSGSR